MTNCAHKSLIGLPPGTLVDGRYMVEALIGTGSMGRVYRCQHHEAGSILALKVLSPKLAKIEKISNRFQNEVVATYAVSHFNVVRTFEYIRNDQITAYTMEYVDGGSISDLISSKKRLPITKIIQLLTNIATGLHAVHEAGIVHRDLKPQNILIATNGNAKIADFGIAKTRATAKLKETGELYGTLNYLAPEYLEKEISNEMTDIYSLGVLAYEMITGKIPHSGNSVYDMIRARVTGKVAVHPSELYPECPVALGDFVLKALSRNPNDRFKDSAKMRMELIGLQSVIDSTPHKGGLVGSLFSPKLVTG